jgi:putative sigma-54 modulation protein
MQLHVKSRHVDVNQALRDHIERKLAPLAKQLPETTQIEVELVFEHNQATSDRNIAEATVWLKGPSVLRARETAVDLKAAVDALARNLERQVKRQRDKVRDGHRHPKASEAAAE